MPYQENGIWYVHNSEISTFRRCRLKWKYAYKDNLVSIMKPRPLYLGTVFHAGLESYYKNEDPVQSMTKAVNLDIQAVIESGKMQNEQVMDYVAESNRRLDLCLQVMKEYIKFDKNQPITRGGKVYNFDGQPMIERTFEVPLEDFYYEDSPVMYRFTLDMAYEEGNGVWIVDHKTGKQFLDVRKLDLDTQLSLYIWALGQIVDKPVIGMEYNMIRMKTPRSPEITKSGKMSIAAIDTTWDIYKKALLDNGLDPNDYEDIRVRLNSKTFFDRKHRYRTKNELKTVEAELKDTIADMMDPNLRIYRNPTNDCSWDCPYKEICVMEFKGEDNYDIDEYIERNFTQGANRRQSLSDIEKTLGK